MMEGARVAIRPIEPRDLPMLVKWTHDPEVNKFVHAAYPHDLDECAAWFRSLKGNRYKKHFAISLKSGRLIGDIELDHITWRSGDAELRVRIGEPEFWNVGLGSEAIELCLEDAFDVMNLSRVYLRVYARNRRAIRCYEKCGFRKEGRLRRPGEEQELILMRILKREYVRRTDRARRMAI